MKITILGIMAFVVLVFTSCQKNTDKVTDADLIQAIQNASNKQNINIAELPSSSKKTLDNDYADNYIDLAKLAPELGYEVDLRKADGYKESEKFQTYFDLSGRELKVDDGTGGNGTKDDKGDNYKRECFDLVYPVTYIMFDETEIIVIAKDDAEGWGEIKAWYEAHPDVVQKPALKYPVDISWKDGTIKTIVDENEMRRAKSSCDDGGDKRKCFRLVYPVTYLMPDGTEIIIDSKEARREIKAWYAAHPDVTERPTIIYPVDIKWKDGTVSTINNEDQMRRAKASCD